MSVGLIFVVFLVCACIFVNGWTDAPNAIATVVSTRVLSPRAAVVLGALFNLLGVYLTGTAVASTTAGIVRIGTGADALITLAAALLSIVIWAVAAWRYGIPTSESHALIAGLMGAGISRGGLGAFNWSALGKVLIGVFISSGAGFVLGYITARLIETVCRCFNRRRTEGFFSAGQIVSASLMAFAHGAQDGQKLMGVFFLALTAGGVCSFNTDGTMTVPVWIMLACAVLIALGTSVGGFRIIKSLGIDMVRLEKYQGFAAEIAASGSLLASTFLGIPMSTTNTKATAMLGAGASRGSGRINWNIAGDMFLAWVLTVPACLILGYVSATLFRYIF